MSESKGNQALVGFSVGEMAQRNDPMEPGDTIVEIAGRLSGLVLVRRFLTRGKNMHQTGFAPKVRLFKISFTPGFSSVIGSWKKFAKPF